MDAHELLQSFFDIGPILKQKPSQIGPGIKNRHKGLPYQLVRTKQVGRKGWYRMNHEASLDDGRVIREANIRNGVGSALAKAKRRGA